MLPAFSLIFKSSFVPLSSLFHSGVEKCLPSSWIAIFVSMFVIKEEKTYMTLCEKVTAH